MRRKPLRVFQLVSFQQLVESNADLQRPSIRLGNIWNHLPVEWMLTSVGVCVCVYMTSNTAKNVIIVHSESCPENKLRKPAGELPVDAWTLTSRPTIIRLRVVVVTPDPPCDAVLETTLHPCVQPHHCA